MENIKSDTIQIEWAIRPGVQQVGALPYDAGEKAAQAIEDGMKTIKKMATHVVCTIQSIPLSERPTEVEVDFGLKFDAETGAFIAKASVEAAINVKLVWKEKQQEE